MKNILFIGLILTTISANAQQWLGSSDAYNSIYRAGRVKAGYGPLYLDWTYQNNWGGNASQWAGYVGFNSFRENNDAKDYYYGDNIYTSMGAFEGSNYGFRWLFWSNPYNQAGGQHLLTEYMRLTQTGDLGIGTGSPDAKLTVKGNIHAQEVKVDLNGAVAPDYVFADNYSLPSLDNVEAFIKENKHLSEIPSATEMEKHGITLGEMNLLLLKKVEELTLYVIQQNKLLQEQRERIDKLEKSKN